MHLTRAQTTRVAALAAHQHGVVARRQLVTLGLTRRMIELRVATGHGYRLLRFTHDDVVRRTARTAVTINAFLADA
jgi:hypothetical protein